MKLVEENPALSACEQSRAAERQRTPPPRPPHLEQQRTRHTPQGARVPRSPEKCAGAEYLPVPDFDGQVWGECVMSRAFRRSGPRR